MTIYNLYNIWYDGNRNDITFINSCCNMLNLTGACTVEERRLYAEIRLRIKRALEDWLYDHK